MTDGTPAPVVIVVAGTQNNARVNLGKKANLIKKIANLLKIKLEFKNALDIMAST